MRKSTKGGRSWRRKSTRWTWKKNTTSTKQPQTPQEPTEKERMELELTRADSLLTAGVLWDLRVSKEPSQTPQQTATRRRGPGATPRRLKGCLVTSGREHLAVQRQLRALRAEVMKNYELDVRADHRQEAWVVRRCSWIPNRFQTQSDGRTACQHALGGLRQGAGAVWWRVLVQRRRCRWGHGKASMDQGSIRGPPNRREVISHSNCNEEAPSCETTGWWKVMGSSIPENLHWWSVEPKRGSPRHRKRVVRCVTIEWRVDRYEITTEKTSRGTFLRRSAGQHVVLVGSKTETFPRNVKIKSRKRR